MGASSSSGQSAASTRQIMATVFTGDVVETAMGRLELTTAGDKPQATVEVSGDAADQVMEGQTVTVMLGGPGQSGEMGSPPDQSGDQPSGDMASPPAGNGQGMPPGGSGMMQGGTEGTVVSVETGSDGTVTATVELEELPDGAEVGDTGMAVIQIKVLAEDVLVVPTQAIETSDGASTVQVMVNGKTETREVELGAQSPTMTEIVSGLGEGDNIVYELEMNRQQGGQMGAPPSGDQTQNQPDSQNTTEI